MKLTTSSADTTLSGFAGGGSPGQGGGKIPGLGGNGGQLPGGFGDIIGKIPGIGK